MISIHWDIAEKLNFACHQSSFAVLRDLRIENSDEENRIDDLLVTLSADPSFLKPKSWQVDRVAPGGMVPINDRALDLDSDFLLKLAESVRGHVTIKVEYKGETLRKSQSPSSYWHTTNGAVPAICPNCSPPFRCRTIR